LDDFKLKTGLGGPDWANDRRGATRMFVAAGCRRGVKGKGRRTARDMLSQENKGYNAVEKRDSSVPKKDKRHVCTKKHERVVLGMS